MDHYFTNYYLHQERRFSLAELDTMIPFERQIYLTIIEQKLQEQQQSQTAPPMFGQGL